MVESIPANTFLFILILFLSIGLGMEGLKSKADELWQNVVRLETEKYDLEMRRERQGYDVSEEHLWHFQFSI